jgi:mono/diheme cytochrome c family protein
VIGAGGGHTLNVLGVAAAAPRPTAIFPFPVTEEVMERGRLKFNVYCAVCHDRLGNGNGRIVQRGYLRPPSLHAQRLRDAPVGHFFEVITNGHGGMPSYSAQIPPRDRWAVIAYVRALQYSQSASERERYQKRLNEANGPKGGNP